VRAKRVHADGKKQKLARGQHIVPRGYLERWATSGRVRVFDGKTGKVFPANVLDAATRAHYHTVELKDGSRTDELEGLFSKIEGPLIPVLERLRLVRGRWNTTSAVSSPTSSSCSSAGLHG
jgi:hypothetical protein